MLAELFEFKIKDSSYVERKIELIKKMFKLFCNKNGGEVQDTKYGMACIFPEERDLEVDVNDFRDFTRVILRSTYNVSFDVEKFADVYVEAPKPEYAYASFSKDARTGTIRKRSKIITMKVIEVRDVVTGETKGAGIWFEIPNTVEEIKFKA